MAFGDIVQAKTATDPNASTISLTLDSTPTADNLLVACHMTGASDSGCTTTGFVRALLVNNTTEADVQAIYWKLAGAAEPTGVTCTRGGAAPGTDEHVLLVLEVAGPWETSPVDLAEAEARQTSGTSYALATAAATAQSDEVAVAVFYTRNSLNGGNVTWSNSFVERVDVAAGGKTSAVATKVLTTAGTVATTASYVTGSDPVMGGIATFKKAAAAGGTGALAATLAALTAAATGTLPLTGQAAPTLAALSSVATGTLPLVGQASLTLGALSQTGAGALALAGTATPTLGALQAQGQATLALTGQAALPLGPLTLVAQEAPSDVTRGGLVTVLVGR